MSTIQERFEVERPVGVVYETLAQPEDVLRALPGLGSVLRVSEDVYRIAIVRGDSMREVELMVTNMMPAQHVEWRLVNGTWSAAFDLDSVGPARTGIAVRTDGVPGVEGETAPAELLSQGFDAFKTALRSPHVRINTGTSTTGGLYGSANARRFASEWRTGRDGASLLSRNIEYPFRLMQGLSKQMDRIWEQVWRGSPISRLSQLSSFPGFSSVPGLSGSGWSPSVEVCEQEDQVRICIDVPGVEEANLQVQIEPSVLIVRGERHDERAGEPGNRRSELHYGSFVRRVPLPEGVDADATQAMLRNGVLEIRIPLHRRQPRRVPVQHVSG